jgi:glycosyltransferase involved in cell wall biosynthesis
LSEWLQKHPREKCEFWIAGDGPLRGELEKYPAPPQLRLRFLGSVAYEELPELYAQGGIFVFPTLADEWGVVVNEALAAGLPILGSLYSQAMEELVEDGRNGWTFRPDHGDEMYAALDRAMTATEEQLDEMRLAGRERVRSLSPAYGAECFVDAIEYVCPPTGKAPSSSKPFAGTPRPSAKIGAPTP